jgi:hypothetical protein
LFPFSQVFLLKNKKKQLHQDMKAIIWATLWGAHGGANKCNTPEHDW